MDLSERQPCFVREVAFEKAMGPDDLQGEAFAFRGEIELLPAGHDQTL